MECEGSSNSRRHFPTPYSHEAHIINARQLKTLSFVSPPKNSMKATVLLIFLSCIYASGRCCSVVIAQPLHLSAVVSLEFSISVSQPSNLSVSIDGSIIFNESVSGNFNFALQARPTVITLSLLLSISDFLFSGTLAGNALLARDCRLQRCH